MLTGRFGLAFLILCGVAVAAVSVGVDRWSTVTTNLAFQILGLRQLCDVDGCRRTASTAPVITLGNCSVSTSTFENLSNAAWGVQIAGVAIAGLGAIVTAVSSKVVRLAIFVGALVVVLVGQVLYVIGGGIAYYTHSSWLYCGLRYCDHFFTSVPTSKFCLSEQGPSFALWCISNAVVWLSLCGGAWLVASDLKKKSSQRHAFKTIAGVVSPQPQPSIGRAESKSASTLHRASSRSRSRADDREPTSSAPKPETPAVPEPRAVPSGFVYRADTGMFYNTEEETFWDQRSGHYYSPKFNSWYDADTKKWYSVQPPEPPAATTTEAPSAAP